MPPHKVVPWVRRQLGGGIVVLRFLTDGTAAVSAPCCSCVRELQRFDLRVSCVSPGGSWFHGRVGEPGAPPQKLTSGQIRACTRQQRGGGTTAGAPSVTVVQS